MDAPGALQHLLVRGIERRKPCQDDRDRDAFLERLGRTLPEAATPCSAWVLMPNRAAPALHLDAAGAGPSAPGAGAAPRPEAAWGALCRPARRDAHPRASP
jgi:hypothetical protein